MHTLVYNMSNFQCDYVLSYKKQTFLYTDVKIKITFYDTNMSFGIDIFNNIKLLSMNCFNTERHGDFKLQCQINSVQLVTLTTPCSNNSNMDTIESFHPYSEGNLCSVTHYQTSSNYVIYRHI